MSTFDVIVLGAGAMGSAAAYYLARAGQRVLLLEQFEIDHQHGSSWGYTRIIRYTYDHPAYIELARATYPLWRAVEDESGEQLVIRTGGIDFGRTDDPTLQATIENARRFALPHELLNAQEAMQRFPQFRFSEDMQVLYQPDSGIVTPSRSVRTHAMLARRHGADTHENEPVERIEIETDSVRITTAQARYSAARLIITAGAWTGRLLTSLGMDLPLQPLACQEAQFHPPAEQADLYSPERMPVYIYHHEFAHGGGMYGLPNYGGYGVKSAFHGGKEYAHPSEIDYTPSSDEVERIRATISAVLPFLRRAPLALTRICLYTMTPDHHFIIDRHPQHTHVVIGAGFSGHGFKFSTGIGQILSDLAIQGSTTYSIDLFSLQRLMSKS